MLEHEVFVTQAGWHEPVPVESLHVEDHLDEIGGASINQFVRL